MNWRTANNRRRRPPRPRLWRWYVAEAWRYPTTDGKSIVDSIREIMDRLESMDHLATLLARDQRDYGVSITKDGARIDPLDFYPSLEVAPETSQPR